MSRRLLAAAALALLMTTAQVAAIYMRIETRQVPTDRLIANLERELKADPTNVQTVINLARLQAMAYALKADEFPAVQPKQDQPERPSYPPGSGQLPTVVRPADSPEHAARAARHLKDAIRHYAAALALEPDNLTARLGHGWTLQQAGDTERAIAEYRLLIKQAWQRDQKLKGLMPSQQVFTNEAAAYLIPLLDKGRDAAEIADLRAKQAQIKALPRAITPVAIPLTDNLSAHAIVDPLARIRFDADGLGAREWTWITPEAGWLVYDADDRGSITSALQWFGNVTFWLFWANGYEPMRALDDDADGELSGRELRHLAIWQDRNRDGISDDGEVRAVGLRGIVALSCRYLEGDGRRFAAFSPYGVRFEDGSTRPTYDVILSHSSSTWTD
jgi:tetratricopeptide (TPR) repeat protein